ncbi:MAG TPA: NAD(P)H-hydrate epimerase [Lacipirellulaceae bacterium]|jgi:NAD(P)H-hydrate epimerase
MDPLILNRDESRAVDRIAIQQYGISSLVLMENAGRGCVDVLERLGIAGPVAILCGKGNNAGDGFVIARHLAIRRHECSVILLCDPQEFTGDAAANFAILQRCNVPTIDLSKKWLAPVAPTSAAQRQEASNTAATQLQALLTHHAAGAAWLVDALLGTGARGEPRPPFDAAIDWINARPATTRALAVDIPSGLDCDTGQPAIHTVRADHTCTFATMKLGFAQPAAAPFTGTIHVCDIGLPANIIASAAN